jgi:adenylate kinase family enzyme
MDLRRTLVIGNSGSGKSWLSEQLANSLGGAWVDLDQLNWEPGGFNVARKRQDVIAMALGAAAADQWIIEGIYGWIVSEILPFATALIWIDIDEFECVENIRHRGMRRGGDAQSFAELLDWAKSYRSRTGSSSHDAHKTIFNTFKGPKACLKTRDEVTAFASSLD